LIATVSFELYGFYTGNYGKRIFDNLFEHPYYKVAHLVKEKTQPDDVVIGFGMGWGADSPYYSERKGVIVPNFAPKEIVDEILFLNRPKWIGHRNIGAIVDCYVFENQNIASELLYARDKVISELNAEPVDVQGRVVGATVNNPHCNIYLPNRSSELSSQKRLNATNFNYKPSSSVNNDAAKTGNLPNSGVIGNIEQAIKLPDGKLHVSGWALSNDGSSGDLIVITIVSQKIFANTKTTSGVRDDVRLDYPDSKTKNIVVDFTTPEPISCDATTTATTIAISDIGHAEIIGINTIGGCQ
jgi:hypothetical protein